MNININNQIGCKLVLYPDNQPHVILDKACKGARVNVTVALRSSLDMMNLLSVSSALDYCGAKKGTLTIPYLLGARSDRVTKPMESVELEVVCELINQCVFQKVIVLDAHSPHTEDFLACYEPATNKFLVQSYELPDAMLICPDKGAKLKCENYFDWNENLAEVIYCTKKRNPEDGRLMLAVKKPEKCKGRNCVIIDDICDGGATFIAIAKQIEPAHLTLMVTHGIFSKGTRILTDAYFDEIITSDSYRAVGDDSKVFTIPFKT